MAHVSLVFHLLRFDSWWGRGPCPLAETCGEGGRTCPTGERDTETEEQLRDAAAEAKKRSSIETWNGVPLLLMSCLLWLILFIVW